MSRRTWAPPRWSPPATTRSLVERVIQLVDRAEYKRRQYPPGPKISAKNFGRDRRLPITNRWREPLQSAGTAQAISETSRQRNLGSSIPDKPGGHPPARGLSGSL